MWQPFINRKTEIRTRPTIIFLLVILSVIYLGGGWSLTLWIIFLTGILSSYRLTKNFDRFVFYLTVVFLMFSLFGGLIPQLIIEQQTEDYALLLNFFGLALLVFILCIPGKTSDLKNYNSDILYSFITVIVVILIALTTLLWMLIGEYDYLESLILAFISLGGLLIAFNLTFKPSSDMGLFAQYRDRYLLNLGSPFEIILQQLADVNQLEDKPETYLESAFGQLLALDWIAGFRWQFNQQTYTAGQSSPHTQPYAFADIEVIIYTKQILNSAMVLHANLLIQIIDIFYQAKRRELELSRQAHMTAIHETGARLTHDIKNLVQSLTFMVTTANTVPTSDASDELFKRNLEVITERLQKTLAKLKNPDANNENFIALSAWWKNITDIYNAADISFIANIDNDIDIPSEAFTNVLSNLHDNAKKKQLLETDIHFLIKLHSSSENFYLLYKDSGSAIPPEIVETVLDAPIHNSKSGFGIGLYQARQQLKQYNFDISIEKNEDGEVSFLISKMPD